MDGDALRLITELIGFDPGTLAENGEKLVSFIGSRDTITINDVKLVVRRTKKDPVFELTNAIARKNVSKALYYAKSLLDGTLHPLQVLAAITNQIRKIILVKSFIEKSRVKGRVCWTPALNYNRFRQETIPEIIKADAAMAEKIDYWDQLLNNDTVKEKKTKTGSSTDLFMAANPKNPYPVYQTFLKSDIFSTHELVRALEAVHSIDFKLKSSGSDPEILLESLIIKICTPGGDNV